MLNRAAAPPAKGSRRAAPPPPRAAHPSRKSRPPFWRNRLWLLALAAVVVVAGVIVAVSLASRGSSSNGNATTPARGETGADRALIDRVGNVDASVAAAVGTGGLAQQFVPIKDATPLLGINGRPEVLYVGADYCPYCAAQRWSLVVALSRFGSFQHLGLTTSSSTDVYPDTATFSFTGMAYTSPYLDFVALETADREGRPLRTPTAEQASLLNTYDVPPYAGTAGGIPWLDVANRYVTAGSGYSPAVLAGLSASDIAAKLGNATDPVARGILGEANQETAAICKATGMQPAAVCAAPAITSLVDALP